MDTDHSNIRFCDSPVPLVPLLAFIVKSSTRLKQDIDIYLFFCCLRQKGRTPLLDYVGVGRGAMRGLVPMRVRV